MSSKLSKAARLVAVCVWVVLGFFIAQVVVIIAVGLVINLGWLSQTTLQKPLAELLLLAVGYSLALGLIILLPRAFSVHKLAGIKAELGVTKKPGVFFLLWSVLGYVVYTILTVVFSVVVQSLWHGFNSNQTQAVGFQGLAGVPEYVMAFVALVVIPPLVEEMLFRGYLFGRLRQNLGFWVSALITSVLFGFVHLQWNVGVDVFALSLVLCFLREKTGTIWAGVGLHMIKNAIAYTLLFLAPDLLKYLF